MERRVDQPPCLVMQLCRRNKDGGIADRKRGGGGRHVYSCDPKQVSQTIDQKTGRREGMYGGVKTRLIKTIVS